MLVDHLEEDGGGGGWGERAELPSHGAAHADLGVAHGRVLTVGRHARTNRTKRLREQASLVKQIHTTGTQGTCSYVCRRKL